MSQQPHESVSDFSHRFLETQNSLEKLLPGIHRSSDGDLELIHAFILYFIFSYILGGWPFSMAAFRGALLKITMEYNKIKYLY